MTGCASLGLRAENPLALGLIFFLANCSFIERFLEFDQLPAGGVVSDFVTVGDAAVEAANEGGGSGDAYCGFHGGVLFLTLR